MPRPMLTHSLTHSLTVCPTVWTYRSARWLLVAAKHFPVRHTMLGVTFLLPVPDMLHRFHPYRHKFAPDGRPRETSPVRCGFFAALLLLIMLFCVFELNSKETSLFLTTFRIPCPVYPGLNSAYQHRQAVATSSICWGVWGVVPLATVQNEH